MALPKKTAVVDSMTEKMKAADAIFVADFNELNVTDMTELRTKLREVDAIMYVAKNTLLRLAAADADRAGLTEAFQGPSAITFTNGDPAACAKVFQDSFSRIQKPQVKVFWVEGRYFTDKELKPLAELPPRDILLSMVVAAFEAPISSLIGTLDGVIRDFVGTIEAIADQKKPADGE